jgi:hypothetical protein
MAAVGWILGARSEIYIDSKGVHVTKAQYQAPVTELTDEFAQIDIETWSADVELIASDHYGYELRPTGTIRLTGEAKNGVLTIRQENAHRFTIMSINTGNWKSDVKVYYPAGCEFKSVRIDTLSGEIAAKSLYAQALTLKAVSGNIAIDHADSQYADIKTTSGEVEILSSGTGFDFVSIQTVSGDVKARGLMTRSLTVKTTSGNFSAQGELRGKTDVNTVSGDVWLDVGWAKTMTPYFIDTVSGSIRIDGERQGGDASFGSRDGDDVITAKTTSGNVTIS